MNYYNDLQKDLTIRIKRLQQEIQKQNADACILSTNVNIFYLAGSIYGGYMYIPAEGEIIHFVKRPQDLDIPNKVAIRKPEQIKEELDKRGINPKTILLELDSTPYNECQRIISSLSADKILNASTLLRFIRSIKTEFELTQIRHCAKQHEAVYQQVPAIYRKGMTDVELQIEIEKVMRQHGSLGIFRSYGENMDIHMGSLLVGENAETPSPFDFALGGKGINPALPLGASGQMIREGQTIMVDMAGNYTPWMTDMTRVFSIGKTSELAYKAHQVSIEIHEEIINLAKAGVPCADLYNKGIEIVTKHNLDAYFMGTKQQAKFIGHGLGLEINEPPVLSQFSKELLLTNTVFALEPKFVIPEVGAVGIENTFLVTDNGIEKLTILEENIIAL